MKQPWPLLIGLVVVAALLAGGRLLFPMPWDPARATHGSPPGQVDFVAIDMDSAAAPANTATSIGSREDCNVIAVDGTVVIDVTVDDINVQDPINAFQFVLNYDPAVVNVTAKDNAMLLAANGSFVPFDFTDSVPDSDGTFIVSISDFGSAPGET
ncbi:MAG: hypothetical protein HYY03_09320, partial [Chloroflexi bacterium]|nr:hypothetical protein [Chloroflexota bacterium]